jgi:non-heme chloroperoxidase
MKISQLYPHYTVINSEKKHELFFLTNHPLDYIQKRKAPLLVFNYGLVCNIHHWIDQLPYFHEKGYHLLFHDYRGHFNSEWPSPLPMTAEELSFPNLACDIQHLLELFPQRDVFMIGHSMGVNVTLHYALRFPKQLKGMILIAGTVEKPHQIMFDGQLMELIFPLSESINKLFPQFFHFLWKFLPEVSIVQHGIMKGGFNPNQVEIEFVRDYLKKITHLSPEIFFSLMTNMYNDNMKTSLPLIKTPALIIAGDGDKVIPLHTQYDLRDRLPQSELYVVSEGSHVPQVDFGEQINERIERFIQKTLSLNKHSLIVK